MIRRSFFIAAIVCLLVGIVSAQTPAYKTYNNARFAYSISYPANLLKPQGEAENGDGQAFRWLRSLPFFDWNASVLACRCLQPRRLRSSLESCG